MAAVLRLTRPGKDITAGTRPPQCKISRPVKRLTFLSGDCYRLMLEKLAELLERKRAAVVRNCNAADVLKEAFRLTDEALAFEDEGCTATVMLVWQDPIKSLFAQCANLGDSHCVFSRGRCFERSVKGKHMLATEDHRVVNTKERARLAAAGHELRDGETRLCGMNIARVLGDKFLKSQHVGLCAEPYVSEPLALGDGSDAFALMASDGLWDVLSTKRAIQLAAEARVKDHPTLDGQKYRTPAEAIAAILVSKARLSRTTDNTTVVALDFAQHLPAAAAIKLSDGCSEVEVHE
eukprot:SM000128S26242  [mRNA]  locus=s128:369130:370676:+ [translate_table: standard]